MLSTQDLVILMVFYGMLDHLLSICAKIYGFCIRILAFFVVLVDIVYVGPSLNHHVAQQQSIDGLLIHIVVAVSISLPIWMSAAGVPFCAYPWLLCTSCLDCLHLNPGHDEQRKQHVATKMPTHARTAITMPAMAPPLVSQQPSELVARQISSEFQQDDLSWRGPQLLP